MADDAQAARVWIGLRTVLLEREDRRREVSQALDMSYVRAKALLRLAKSPAAMRDLTQVMATDAPYTTLVVDDLERRGLVVRSVNPEDKRTKIVTATPTGLQVAALAEEIINRPPESLLALPAKDLAVLEHIVTRLLADG